MQCAKNNCWKIIFVLFICLIAFIGYRASNKNTAHTHVTVPIDNHAMHNTLSKEALDPLIRDFILNHPDVIIESIELMHKRKMKEMEDQIQNTIKEKLPEIENSNNSPHAGNANGNATIVVFYDYNCNYCKKSNDVINQLLRYDDEVKIIYKPMPMLGEVSDHLARLTLAVYKIAPDKFKVIHDDLMTLQNPSKDAIKDIVEKNGVNFAELEVEMSKPEIRDMQSKIISLASDLRIHGAPAFIINGKFYPGLLEFAQMQKLVAEQRIQPKATSKDVADDNKVVTTTSPATPEEAK